MEYQKYEYCEFRSCPWLKWLKSGLQKIRCQELCEAYKFHDYLQNQGYKIIKAGE